MKHTILPLLAILLASCTTPAGTRNPEPRSRNSVGWRGDGAGVYEGVTPPTEWAPDRNVAWKTKLPSWSNGSPALAADRLFVTSEPLSLLCLAKRDGMVLWKTDLEGPQFKGQKEVGGTTPTPALDLASKRTFVFFASGVTAGCDFDGNVLWTRKLLVGPAAWGHSSSPLFTGGKLVVCHGSVSGLDPATGDTVWTVRSKMRQGSPVAVSLAGKDCVISPTGLLLDAADGTVISSKLPSPQFNASIVKDGMLYVVGLDDTKAAAYSLAEAAGGAPARRWETEIKKGRYFGSPVYWKGLVFGIRQSGTVVVLDAQSGEKKREHPFSQMHQQKGQCYPSLTIAGGWLYLSSDNGTTLVLEPTPELAVVAENRLERTRACPVFEENRAYVRGMTHLWCLQGP